jgi:hypothetical protein
LLTQKVNFGLMPFDRIRILYSNIAHGLTTMAQVPDDLRSRFVAGGQGHVFEFVDNGKATAAETTALISQLQTMDVTLINELYRETTGAGGATPGSDGVLEPADRVTVLAGNSDATQWRSIGLKAVAAGQAGVIILAGGQGTRLGFDRPKGEYDIGLSSHKSLFQLQIERILRVKQLAAEQMGLSVADVSLVSGRSRQSSDASASRSLEAYHKCVAHHLIWRSCGPLLATAHLYNDVTHDWCWYKGILCWKGVSAIEINNALLRWIYLLSCGLRCTGTSVFQPRTCISSLKALFRVWPPPERSFLKLQAVLLKRRMEMVASTVPFTSKAS